MEYPSIYRLAVLYALQQRYAHAKVVADAGGPEGWARAAVADMPEYIAGISEPHAAAKQVEKELAEFDRALGKCNDEQLRHLANGAEDVLGAHFAFTAVQVLEALEEFAEE
jgi:hypothetical protein